MGKQIAKAKITGNTDANAHNGLALMVGRDDHGGDCFAIGHAVDDEVLTLGEVDQILGIRQHLAAGAAENAERAQQQAAQAPI